MPPQIRLSSLMWLSAGLPIWIFLAVVVPMSTGFRGGLFRFMAAPLVLCGITFAVAALIAKHRDRWPISIFMAGVIAGAALSIASWLAD